ncbi:hypothetical protein KEM09_18745 [Carboxylicivirga mesophila]|uniref:Outer membrane protein beta-barrel domain-containing protein n=1 Tax=Carboxylicivirga mesophila TaxID=1166478 RepID=A0ABS5KEL8_9BACT|nr:hypothetical protein [Carboxylicivirga mesophila]MBS2213455.1 hypothetical protein [Carboxylicivirga mesophila]
MKKVLLLLSIFIGLAAAGQETTKELSHVFRINALNPGVELEMPISSQSTLSINPGIGIHGSNKNLTYTSTGVTYFISPFLDVAYKKIYNRAKRDAKGKTLDYNSGNFWSLRLLTSFKEFESKNIYRKDDISFEFGPTWGIQRTYSRVHLLFDIGPSYYFDTKGNSGFFPLMVQLNIGFNIKNW